MDQSSTSSVTTKRLYMCRRCRAPITPTPAQARRSDFMCSSCSHSKLAAWRQSNPERIQVHRARYKQTHAEQIRAADARRDKKRRDRAAERFAKWHRQHPDVRPVIRKVHLAVLRAIRKGLLVRPDNCEACQRSGCQIDAAHYDYAEPLRVRWLCKSCHTMWDAREPKTYVPQGGAA